MRFIGLGLRHRLGWVEWEKISRALSIFAVGIRIS